MKITDVKVFPVDEDKLKAYATITFENCFIVRDLKVISGNKGYFIAMPSKKRKDGTFRDVAHPLNSETRKMIEDAVLEVYEAEEASTPSRDTGASADEYATDGAVTEEPATQDAAVEAEDSEQAPVSEEEAGFSADQESAESAEDEEEEQPASGVDAHDAGGDAENLENQETAEPGEPVKSAADNPTIEPVDDPEKAFGYEE